LCGQDGWGIPAVSIAAPKPARKVAKPAPEVNGPSIKAIIATVPDPLRSSTPWEFDRSIQVLTQAAAGYGYVGSYFWLPWQQAPIAKNGADQTGEGPQKTAKDREKLPGLLILKQENALPGSPFQFESPDHEGGVLYLFLVGQSPAAGVNGE